MERNHHRRHVPYCETRVALVDQYMWPEKDTTEKVCHNGISHPIYNCQGDISRTLPLSMYPKVNEVHPHVRKVPLMPHFLARDPHTRMMIATMERDKAEGRIEGIYTGSEYEPYDKARSILG